MAETCAEYTHIHPNDAGESACEFKFKCQVPHFLHNTSRSPASSPEPSDSPHGQNHAHEMGYEHYHTSSHSGTSTTHYQVNDGNEYEASLAYTTYNTPIDQVHAAADIYTTDFESNEEQHMMMMPHTTALYEEYPILTNEAGYIEEDRPLLNEEQLWCDLQMKGGEKYLKQRNLMLLPDSLQIIGERRAIARAILMEVGGAVDVILKMNYLMEEDNEGKFFWMEDWICAEVDCLFGANAEKSMAPGVCRHSRGDHIVPLLDKMEYNVPKDANSVLSGGKIIFLAFPRGCIDLEDYVTRLKEQGTPEQLKMMIREGFWMNIARRVMPCVIEGLRECHERGLVHADIKPTNVVLFLEDGQADFENVWHIDLDRVIFVLIDFELGFVKQKLDRWGMVPSEEEVIASGIPRGTPGFFSPEMVCVNKCARLAHTDHTHAHEDYDFQLGTGVDFWCLGLLMYYIIEVGVKVARCPYVPEHDLPFGTQPIGEGYDCLKFLYNSFMVDYQNWMPGASDVPSKQEARDLICWLLEWNPSNRPQSVDDILRHPWFASQDCDPNAYEPVETAFCLAYSLTLQQKEGLWFGQFEMSVPVVEEISLIESSIPGAVSPEFDCELVGESPYPMHSPYPLRIDSGFDLGTPISPRRGLLEHIPYEPARICASSGHPVQPRINTRSRSGSAMYTPSELSSSVHTPRESSSSPFPFRDITNTFPLHPSVSRSISAPDLASLDQEEQEQTVRRVASAGGFTCDTRHSPDELFLSTLMEFPGCMDYEDRDPYSSIGLVDLHPSEMDKVMADSRLSLVPSH